MREVKFKELTLEGFAPYGYFTNMLNPEAIKIGEKPIEFFRDMLKMDLGGNTNPSFSICRVEKRDFIVDTAEFHSYCGEANLPLDGDVLIHVAHATPDAQAPIDKFEVFRVPKGTMVVLKPGVWHHAPFAYNCNVVNTLVVLPERTYANDCYVAELKGDQRIKIICTA